MLGDLIKGASSMFNKAEKLVNRAMNQKEFKLVVYTTYLIASADGDFDSQEKAAAAKLINRDFPEFTTADITKLVAECDNKIAFDKTLGNQELLDFLSTANADEARLVMRVCAFIGAADGDYDKDEKMMARTIAYTVKVTPSDYGL